jgi:acyl-CoA-binding protein
MSETEKRFKKAVDFIQGLPKEASSGSYESPAQEKLQLYGLFKQSTDGKCNQKKPSMINVVAKAKW